MKVLLVAYHFSPDEAVGAIRAGRLARVLKERGHDVHVLAGPFPGKSASTAVDGITVERLEPILDPRATYARFRRRIRGRSVGPARHAEPKQVPWTPPSRVGFWKRHFTALLWLPDDRQGWLAAAVRRGRALGAGAFDVIYTTAPPFSAHLAGLGLRNHSGNARWIAEFRDPWTDNPIKLKSGRTQWSDRANRWLERACLRRADRVVCVTESVASLLQERVGAGSNKISVVRNGIDHEGLDESDAQPANGRILYAGNLYHSRDPRPVLRGLADLQASGDLPARAAVDFVGDCSHFRDIDVGDFARQLGIDHLVSIRGSISHDESLAMMRNASVLLLLAQKQPLQVPNKLYEYLGARRPILAFADRDGETAHMLEQVGGHVVLQSTEPAHVRRAILTALESHVELTAQAEALLGEWSTSRQLSRLAETVEELGPGQ